MAKSPRTERKRGGAAFRHVAQGLKGRHANTAAKRGFAEPEVLMRWPEIVGGAVSSACRPVKVSYGASHSLGATLIVEVDGARAPEVEAMSPRILERINQYYGYRAVSRMRITQTGAPGFAEAQAGFAGKAEDDRYPTHAGARGEAARLAATIKSPRLRATLGRLGALVLSRTDTATK